MSTREVQRQNYRNNLPPPAWFEWQAARILAIIGALPMPSEIGGKKFAMDFRSMIQGEVAKALDEGRTVIRQATSELTSAIKEQSHGAARVIRQEAQHIRDALGEYTGNNPPEDEAEVKAEKQVIKAEDVGTAEPVIEPEKAAEQPAPKVIVDQIIPTEPPRATAPPMPAWAPTPNPTQ